MLREIVSNEIFTVLLVICLVLLAIAKLLYTKRFHDFINIISNFRYLKVYSRDQKFIDGFEAILFTNLLISGSIFGYLLYENFIGEVKDSYTLLFQIAVGFAAVVLSKVLIERLIGSLFSIDNIMDVYVFQKLSYKNFIGVLLVPINATLLFSISISPTILLTILIVFLLINCIGLIASYKTYQSLIKPNLFYFILYLCALEISPYLVIYKLFIDYA
ncbi:DUF4271 domain-containing protein [Oceanihabitans sediminis]|uniref:DUF4271 domain-containing protein n=1 Tax=Oceanihabitans sediminis TaxID=1812012 RepID=A0A368P6Z3_9FLAO|nr:DUF4271 domain-containing protein [Oceanihabitans sediminis]MDX1278738.1 DUF4271 domain-containing protein [Oceanihabitans sediminis]MDX1773262.1 DUF4271 domain-containing protein [Oceanihabitans sediminis]RBP34955.1 uncharacterized protein DUF4271 [Oceanihabitans sediminis]RCU58592.1 DUF4271 domain-containing protein [Oceanihabitans sediminis]